MNQRQLYWLMFLLMALVLILDKPAKVVPVPMPDPMEDRTELPSNSKKASGNESMYPVGLALSGGGVKAFAHVGVLKALEEQGVRPNIISGVSAGAIVGALYSDGYSPDSIVALFDSIRVMDYFQWELPKGGLLSMNGFRRFLDEKLTAETFEELSIPLRVVATNLDQGSSVVFSSGNLVDALIASSSVPVLFNPYLIDGVNYVDGGVLQNLPASALRSSCKTLIGVSLGPISADPYQKSILDIALRSYKFIFRNNAVRAKAMCDILIEPARISAYNGADIMHFDEIYQIGYEEALLMLEENQLFQALK